MYNHYKITEQIEDLKLQKQMDIFLSTFFFKQALYRFNYRKDFNGVYFSQSELRAIFNYRNYPEMVELAAELGIERLEFTNKYGRQLYYFRPINDTLECSPLDFVPHLQASNLKEAQKRKKRQLSSEGRIVLENLKLLEFNCNQKEYLDIITGGYDAYVSKKQANNRMPLDLEGYLREAMEYWSRIEDFRKARGYDFLDYLWEDTFGGRLHSMITCCPSSLKESGYIRLAGEPIVCLDLHQSQPSLLGHVLWSKIGDNSFSRELRECHDIYEIIKDRLGLPDRGAAKQQMFRMMFGFPKDKASKLFLEMYPDAGKWINQLKFTQMHENPSQKKHSNLAYLLQRLESKIFREIWQILDKEDIIFLTVHDEVIVKEEASMTTRMIMYDVFHRSGIEKIMVKENSPSYV